MRLRRLEVAGFAGIDSAAVNLGPRLNVLHGPNELGKSTLVDAIRAALLLQHTSSAGDGLLDWHVAAPATVALTFEEKPGRVWRVRKSFGPSRHAVLEFSGDGTAFSRTAAGREADGELRRLLRWGVPEPGGKGSGHGMPSSLIATALLGGQGDVEAVLRASLAKDKDATGRERLTRALQVLAEDPRFTHVVNAVQAKVDEAFTPGGKPKKGANSPWTGLAAEVAQAMQEHDQLRKLAATGHQTREHIATLSHELVEAKSEAAEQRRRADLDRRRAEAEAALSRAEDELARIDGLLADLQRSEADLAAAAEAADRLAADCAELGGKVRALHPQAEEAQGRVREIESGGGEDQRRQRELEAENRRLGISQALDHHARRTSAARALETAHGRISALDKTIRDNARRAGDERAAAGLGTGELQTLRRGRQAVRYIAARRSDEARTAERDEAQAHVRRAAELTADAESAREKAVALSAPDAEEIARLRKARTDLEVAERLLDVGFVAEVVPTTAADAEVDVDGGSVGRRRLDAGAAASFEARRELGLRIPGVVALRVRGGDRERLDTARAARELWESASAPVFARTGCTGMDELEALRSRSDRMFADSRRLASEAAAEAARGAGLDLAEQHLAAAGAETEHERAALAAFLEGEEVDGFLARFDERAAEDAADARIAELEAEAAERGSRIVGLEQRIEADGQQLAGLRRQASADEAEFAKEGVADGDWRRFLADAAEQRARLDDRLAEVATELSAVRQEATSEADEARRQADDLALRLAEAERRLAERIVERDAAMVRRGELNGTAKELRKQAERENRHVAVAARDAARDAVDALPPADDAAIGDPRRLDELVRTRVPALEASLRKAEGALEQMGGRHLDERAGQAEEALAALDVRERELKLDYDAYRLLREALDEAEKSNASHLGNALVQPVSERMDALTGGRYGDVSIGPELDAEGIRLGGTERGFDSLSVGTREQIALLLRLSIAETLKTFIVLDDQLTQSDGRRMAAMRDMLAAAAEHIQVIVLTCHPDDYEGAGSPTMVDLSACMTRTLPNAGGDLESAAEGGASVMGLPGTPPH